VTITAMIDLNITHGGGISIASRTGGYCGEGPKPSVKLLLKAGANNGLTIFGSLCSTTLDEVSGRGTEYMVACRNEQIYQSKSCPIFPPSSSTGTR